MDVRPWPKVLSAQDMSWLRPPKLPRAVVAPAGTPAMSGALPAFLPAHHAHGLQIPVLLDDNQLRCYNCHIYITDTCQIHKMCIGSFSSFAYTASPEVRAGARPSASPLNFMRRIRHTWAKHTRCVRVLQLLCLHRIPKNSSRCATRRITSEVHAPHTPDLGQIHKMCVGSFSSCAYTFPKVQAGARPGASPVSFMRRMRLT